MRWRERERVRMETMIRQRTTELNIGQGNCKLKVFSQQFKGTKFSFGQSTVGLMEMSGNTTTKF